MTSARYNFPPPLASSASSDRETGQSTDTTSVELVQERRPRRYLHLFLFLSTFVTTTLVGGGHYLAFISDFGTRELDAGSLLIPQGLWYSMTILSILGAHEFGHYLTCRYYGVSASLPYFIPAPFITGTLGAFIRIRGPIQTKPTLFDIGVAGPLAGFVVAVPALVVGLSLSRLTPLPPDFSGLSLGEPLLFQFTSWLIFGSVPEGFSVNLHPMGFAAWFGLLATALNLFPIGQLDGGHLTYAVFGKRSTFITFCMMCITALLTFLSRSWVVWTILLAVMLVVFGPRHPATLDEDLPLDRCRQIVGLMALVILVLCFTPIPIEPFELIKNP